MTHKLGRLVADGRTFTQSAGLDLVPSPSPLGGQRFVILHFDSVSLSGGAQIRVDLGYGVDAFGSGAGTDFWTRPIDRSISPIPIRIVGGSGSARLREYGVGEPSIIGTPGQPCGSRSNPDVFLHTSPFDEPIYETRLTCGGALNWLNAGCALPLVSSAVKDRVAAAVGIIVEVHGTEVSSCSGTLIGPDLFLTARHCLTDPAGEDVRSASVTFDYDVDCSGNRPSGHVTRFFKVVGEVVSGSPPTGGNPPSSTDWVVVRLDASPGALPAPLEMRDAALMTGEVIFTMHHPGGSVKKMQSGTHSGGFSITGFDYAGGSSGSALFDANGRLVAGPLSTGGSCAAPGACSVGYAPIAPVKAAITNPPAPPRPLDVMIVFDKSGSMSSSAPPAGRTKLQEAQDAAALFVQLVREGAGDRLGMVTFSNFADLPTSIGPAAAKKTELVGPAPFTGGDIGAITPGGSTSIGAGLGVALLAFGGGSTNDRAMLLLSDGLQNTPPTVEEVEGFLGTTRLNVIGFGSDADIDGPLLSRVARQHGGQFTRALDGLALRKFFGLAFGNIFEAGALLDPDHILPAGKNASEAHKFSVCGEEQITLILGWDDISAPLTASIRTPSGKLISARRLQPVRGRSWVFWRIPLPYLNERDGTWTFIVERVPGGGEFPPPSGDVRYFTLVVCSGGPKLAHLGGPRRVYTGDPVDPLVALHYANRTSPHHAQVDLYIDAPGIALGQLVMDAGLRAPSITGDAVDGFHASLQAIARRAGGALPVPTTTIHVPLYDDGGHDDGAMEPDGIYNHRLEDLTRVEGTYQFRAVAAYGEDCTASRETFWSIHVEPGIDPGRSDVTLVGVETRPDGQHGTLVITPRDRYGNPLGPGRGDGFTVTPLPGVTVGGGVKDRGDGSYAVDVTWDSAIAPTPGVLVSQPDRDPVAMTPGGQPVGSPCACNQSAEQLLDCLGIQNPDVKRVRVKSVTIEVDLEEKDCGKGAGC